MTDPTETADYLVIDTDGTLTSGVRRPGGDVRQAITAAANLPEDNSVRAENGYLRGLTIWCADRFAGLYTNPVADRVIARLGYTHPSGWRGPVALTMSETGYGDIPALTTATRVAVAEALAAVGDEGDEGDEWAPLIGAAPDLLADMMYMSTLTLNTGQAIRQYKHRGTRRYLNLDTTGQPWWIAVGADGTAFARPGRWPRPARRP
jgi:hypothetical protein